MSEDESSQRLPHPRNSQFNWQRGIQWFLAEFLVVVLGILVALGLNGWWTDRVERAQERDLLLGLQVEFEANLALFDRTADLHRETIEQSRQLIELTGPNPGDIDLSMINNILFPLLSEIPSFHPALGEIEAMLGAGQLGLIRNDQLRAAVAGWPGALAVLRETEDEMRSDVVQGFYPYMTTRFPLVTLDSSLGFIDTPRPSRFPADYAALLSDVEFENHVENRWVMAKFILRDGEPVRKRLNDVLCLINSELAGAARTEGASDTCNVE